MRPRRLPDCPLTRDVVHARRRARSSHSPERDKAAGDLAILLLLARSQSRHRHPDLVSKTGRILCAGLDCGLSGHVHLRRRPVHCVSGFNHRSHLSNVGSPHRNHGATIQDRLVGIEPMKGAQRPGASLQPRVFDNGYSPDVKPGMGWGAGGTPRPRRPVKRPSARSAPAASARRSGSDAGAWPRGSHGRDRPSATRSPARPSPP